MTNPALAIELPDGSRAYRHPLTGEQVPSVTTVIGMLAKPRLTGWAARLAAEYAVREWATLAELSSWARTEAIRYEHDRVRDKSATLGTNVHAAIEAWIKGEPCEYTKEVDPFMTSFTKFVMEKRPRFTHSEVTVWSREHQYAGTADGILEMNGETWLVDFKGLALDTPLPTPSGWTTMQAVQVGDQLFDRHGNPCRVTAKSSIHFKPCYRVRFDDKSEVICDHDHRWLTITGRSPDWLKTEIQTTEEIAARLFGNHGQRDQRVPLASSLNLPEQDLPIDPYVLGCWLGDGKNSSGEISGVDRFIFDEITHCGYIVGPNLEKREGACPTYTIYKLRTKLREIGLLKNKHIPYVYLRASATQRLALLQGLMDTDGGWNKARNSVAFSVTDKSLACQVHELLLTLGQRANFHEYTGHGFGKDVTVWRVTFTPNGINPFRLPRKADLVKEGGPRSHSSRRVIVSAETTVSVRTQCVMVDSPDHTYLCGEAMIPTHNTGKSLHDEVGLQLSALARAEFIIAPDGRELEMPTIDRLAAIHIRPRSWHFTPVNCHTENFEAFLAARKLLNWSSNVAPRVLGRL